jgi:hypothetical protein
VDSRGDPVDRFRSFAAGRLRLLGDSAADHSLGKRCPKKYYEALNQALIPSLKYNKLLKIPSEN